MATFPGAAASLAEITTSFWWPATSAPSGWVFNCSARWARTIALWLLNTATVVIARLGGIGAGTSFTASAAKMSLTIFRVGNEQSNLSAILCAMFGDMGARK